MSWAEDSLPSILWSSEGTTWIKRCVGSTPASLLDSVDSIFPELVGAQFVILYSHATARLVSGSRTRVDFHCTPSNGMGLTLIRLCFYLPASFLGVRGLIGEDGFRSSAGASTASRLAHSHGSEVLLLLLMCLTPADRPLDLIAQPLRRRTCYIEDSLAARS